MATKRRATRSATGSEKSATAAAGVRSRKPPAKRAATVARPLPGAAEVLAMLQKMASARVRDEMGPRYGIHSKHALGVPVGKIKALAKTLGRSHALSLDLWATGCYEARLLAAFVGEPERVTAAQMNRLCRDFDNWGVCDTVCFALFDRVSGALARVPVWAAMQDEFQRRAGFALLACIALHDRELPDEAFAEGLHLVETAASDDRNFVKKGVLWGLRAIGERSSALRVAAMQVAERMAGGKEAAGRWIGRAAVRELGKRSRARGQ